MVLIVDSGSTKSDWVLLKDSTVVERFNTMGFNPFFHTEHIIARAIRSHDGLREISGDISQVFYYGAGCSSPELNAVVERALAMVFPNSENKVAHDLAACAYATYGGQPAIACILGTGSNSCAIDESGRISEAVPSLAYILGDEGSGSYYGKKLLAAFLYGKLPEDIHNDFVDQYGLDKDTIFEHVYQKPHANVYLASFMRFISNHKDDPFFREMVEKGMREFMAVHVCSFVHFREVKVHFIGSISYFFERELRAAAESLDITVGKIVRKPIDGLVQYHIDQGFKD